MYAGHKFSRTLKQLYRVFMVSFYVSQTACHSAGTPDSHDKKPCLTAVSQRTSSITASEPAPVQSSNSPEHQPQRSTASDTDSARPCPLAMECCPAMNIQFLAEPSTRSPSKLAALQQSKGSLQLFRASPSLQGQFPPVKGSLNSCSQDDPSEHKAKAVSSIAALPSAQVTLGAPSAQLQKKVHAAWSLSQQQQSTAMAQKHGSAADSELHKWIPVGQMQHIAAAVDAQGLREDFGNVAAEQAQDSTATQEVELQRHSRGNAVAYRQQPGAAADSASLPLAPDLSSRYLTQ